jgi:PncC family amidohydrolase
MTITLLKQLTTLSLQVVTIESLTGGLLADAFIRIPGASKVFLGGYVVYHHTAKESWLGISKQWMAKHPSVSDAMAKKLVEKGLSLTKANIVIAATGNAGPTVLDNLPVGCAFISVGNRHHTISKELALKGSRQTIRRAVVNASLVLLKDFLQAYYSLG